jgi:hypothetical protein
MAFSMQIFLIFLLVIVGIVISTKLLMLRVSTFILLHLLILGIVVIELYSILITVE